MATQIDIISQSLVLLGDVPITSLEEDTRAAGIAKTMYNTIYENSLSIEPWNFSMTEHLLSRIDGETNNSYEYAFQLPHNFLRCITVNEGEGSNDFDIYQDKLYSNDDSINLLYVFKVEEKFLPAWFVQYLVYSLAKGLTIPLTDSTSRLKGMQDLEGEQLAEARYINLTEVPQDGWYTLSELGRSNGRRSPTRNY